MGRKAKARELIRTALLAGGKGWGQLLKETGLAKAALSKNLRRMRQDREVLYETGMDGNKARKFYRLSELGTARAVVSGLSKGVTGQVSSLLEKMGHSNPSRLKGWLKGRKGLHLEIDHPGLGKVRLTLRRRRTS